MVRGGHGLLRLPRRPRHDRGGLPLHFRRQYRHPGAPAFEIEVFEKGEEMVEWQKKTDRKQAANQRVATNQRKPLKLTVGLRVLVEDKQGNNTLPGEIVGVRSQPSCWVRMEGSDRIFLRNRRFLEKDPSFNTQQLNMLRREVEHEGLGGRGPAEDSTAAEFSARLSQKPALRSSGVASQPGGGKSVTFADSAEAEPVAGPRQPVAVAALESSAGRGALQPGTRVTFADVLKSSSGRPAHQPGSKAATAAGSRLLATGPRAGTEQLATEACQQEG